MIVVIRNVFRGTVAFIQQPQFTKLMQHDTDSPITINSPNPHFSNPTRVYPRTRDVLVSHKIVHDNFCHQPHKRILSKYLSGGV